MEKSKIKNQKSKFQFKIKNFEFCIVILIFTFCILNFLGCVVRTYPVTKERVDQNLSSGNRGYLQGQVSLAEGLSRKATRTTRVVEIELHSPLKFEKMPKVKPEESKPIQKRDEELFEGNRGYITQSITPEIVEPKVTTGQNFGKYTVQKNDTLQKVSKKFYGTSKKWNEIYNANRDKLKGPDKIYPGQVINIPLPTTELEEPKENLK